MVAADDPFRCASVIGRGEVPGIPVYAVSLQFTPLGPLGGSFVNASTPEFFLTQ